MEPRNLLRIMALVVLVLITNFSISGQPFVKGDFSLTVTGFSDELKSAFESNLDVFVDKFNSLEIPIEMKPIQIFITYQNGVGEILFKAAYTDKLVNDSNMGRPLTKYFYLFIPWRIFNATNAYLTNIAFQTNRREILKFQYVLTLSKANNDWLDIYATSRGFYSGVRFSVGRIEYEAETSTPTNLNRTLIFLIGETAGLDGKENSNFYLCKFLGL